MQKMREGAIKSVKSCVVSGKNYRNDQRRQLARTIRKAEAKFDASAPKAMFRP
jgi:hypothetical protein